MVRCTCASLTNLRRLWTRSRAAAECSSLAHRFRCAARITLAACVCLRLRAPQNHLDEFYSMVNFANPVGFCYLLVPVC